MRHFTVDSSQHTNAEENQNDSNTKLNPRSFWRLTDKDINETRAKLENAPPIFLGGGALNSYDSSNVTQKRYKG